MKVFALLALAGVSSLALASGQDEQSTAQQELPLEQYTYDMDLDIDHVISVGATPNVCAVAPVEMVYEDHQGKRHRLQYQVFGNGCDNG
ncbi:DUF2790 domain-containing protein [Pseudomonas sp. UL073]|uniref:DUF2790 domain-containing protein n=1 Tax=Zestomonas insulae TaxID=2809017 RepID=A0ABS2II90_9GAMM|nr:DUF2790 domain-containing protein [Pseudomonas insulae]MBM7062786.1 DUF2790 domain-containing protein [Pseudomonas insulae]